MITAGYDPYKGYQVYKINSEGLLKETKCALSGSGSIFIQGFIDENYNENFTKEEAYQFIKKAISLSIKRDGSSGGIIRLMDITESGLQRAYETPVELDVC